jgi:hypothetical protein
MAVGGCAMLGAAVGTFDYAGRSLGGTKEGMTLEERRKAFFKQRPEPAAAAEE